MGQSTRFSSDSLEQIVDKTVHDGHCFTGNAGIGMNLFNHFVDLYRVAFLSLLTFRFLAVGTDWLSLYGFLSTLGARFRRHSFAFRLFPSTSSEGLLSLFPGVAKSFLGGLPLVHRGCGPPLGGDDEWALGGGGRVFALVGEGGAEDGGLTVFGDGDGGLSVVGLGVGVVGLGVGGGVVVGLCVGGGVNCLGVGRGVDFLGVGRGVGSAGAEASPPLPSDAETSPLCCMFRRAAALAFLFPLPTTFQSPSSAAVKGAAGTEALVSFTASWGGSWPVLDASLGGGWDSQAASLVGGWGSLDASLGGGSWSVVASWGGSWWSQVASLGGKGSDATASGAETAG
ncbi:unnamed protein product [Acanthosepion pharaonis]|uniref:Uncharacterized protein n=1 Tax=Acanthosepion pharaonis TaxID=158019 RepID=A0A812D5Z5_ACAPH|nr:unnamed protein product [Sepia pharaonis]